MISVGGGRGPALFFFGCALVKYRKVRTGNKKAESTIANCVACECAIFAVTPGRDVKRVVEVVTWNLRFALPERSGMQTAERDAMRGPEPLSILRGSICTQYLCCVADNIEVIPDHE